jgi:hypothetical protein
MILLPDTNTCPAYRRSRIRGTAEIELLLATMFILIPILLITGGMLILGPARILNAFVPGEAAYQDAIVAETPGSTEIGEGPGSTGSVEIEQSDIQLVDPVTGDVPSHLDELQQLNRIHDATSNTDVTVKFGTWMSLPTITLTNKVAFTAPAWSYTGWPASPGDSSSTEQWVESYAAESTAPYQVPLGLQPAWPP